MAVDTTWYMCVECNSGSRATSSGRRIAASTSLRTGIDINVPVRVSYPRYDANAGADLLTNVYKAKQQISDAWKDFKGSAMDHLRFLYVLLELRVCARLVDDAFQSKELLDDSEGI